MVQLIQVGAKLRDEPKRIDVNYMYEYQIPYLVLIHSYVQLLPWWPMKCVPRWLISLIVKSGWSYVYWDLPWVYDSLGELAISLSRSQVTAWEKHEAGRTGSWRWFLMSEEYIQDSEWALAFLGLSLWKMVNLKQVKNSAHMACGS